MATPPTSRRSFLKAAGIASTLTLPLAAGCLDGTIDRESVLAQHVDKSLLEEPVDRMFGVEVTRPKTILRHDYLRELRPYVSRFVYPIPPGVGLHRLERTVYADEKMYVEGDFTTTEVIGAIPEVDILNKEEFQDWVICMGIGFVYGITDGKMILPEPLAYDQEAIVKRGINRLETSVEVDVADRIRTLQRKLVSEYRWLLVEGPDIRILGTDIEPEIIGFGQSIAPANSAVTCTSCFQFEVEADPVADHVRSAITERSGLLAVQYRNPRVKTDGNILTLTEALPAATLNE